MRSTKDITILVCDDSPEIRDVIGIYLKAEGYTPVFASDGAEAVECVDNGGVDLVILDIMMPGTDGLEACRIIRERHGVPILFLTAKSDTDDKVAGLDAGGDDFLGKPFEPAELTARVRALLRRHLVYGNQGTEDIRFDNLLIQTSSGAVFLDGEEVSLTRTEYSILALLAENRGVLFSIDKLLEAVWGDISVSRNTAMVHIRKLREKLRDDPKNPRFIKTIWGRGYKMDEPPR